MLSASMKVLIAAFLALYGPKSAIRPIPRNFGARMPEVVVVVLRRPPIAREICSMTRISAPGPA
jgi:hypothetical protein